MKQLYVSARDIKKDNMRSEQAVTFDPSKQPTLSVPQTKKSGRLRRIIERWNNLPTARKVLLWAVCIAVIALIGAGSYYFILIGDAKKEPIKITETLIYSEIKSVVDTQLTTFLPTPSIPRDAENPINGELYTQEELKNFKKNPPLAVMVENHTAARPQSGLDKADIVYEALAEGGITRFMAIFWGKEAKVIGPIRSARFYFIELLSEYDAIYMHIGGAQKTGNPKVDAIEAIYRYGIHNLDTGGSFYRVKDRLAPHNAYSSTATLWGISDKRGWDAYDQPTAWKFKRDAKPADRGDNTVANIRFLTGISNGGAYDTAWTYDKKTNLYYRNNGGLAHKDKESGVQYSAKNVVIQSVKMQFAVTGHAHVIHDIIGSGDAKILQDGKVIDATWNKANRTSRTIFKDKAGKEIQFNRGQIWVEIYPYQWGNLKITQ
jgi:hypothetical protein